MDDTISINSINIKQHQQRTLKKLSLQSFSRSKQNLNAEDEHILSNNNISFIPLVKENSFLIGNNDDYSELNSQRQNILSRQDDQFEFKTDNLLDFGLQTAYLKNEKDNQHDIHKNNSTIFKDFESIKHPKENNYIQNEMTMSHKILSQSMMNSSQAFGKKYDKVLEDEGDEQFRVEGDELFGVEGDEEDQDKNRENIKMYGDQTANKQVHKKRKRHQIATEANFDDLSRLDFDFHSSDGQTQNNEKQNKSSENDDENKTRMQMNPFDYRMFKRQREILCVITKKNLKHENIQIKKFVDFCISLLAFQMGKIQLEGNVNLLSDFMSSVIVPYILILNHSEANKLLPVMNRLNTSKYLNFCYKKNVDLKQFSNVVNGHILIRMCKELSWRIKLFNALVILFLILSMIYRIALLAFTYYDFQEINDGNLKYPKTNMDTASFVNQILFLVSLILTLAFYIKALLFYIKKYIKITTILLVITFIFNIIAFCLSMALFQKPRPIKQQISPWAQKNQIILFCLNLISISLGFLTTSYTLTYCKRIECFLQIQSTSNLLDL